LVAFAPGKVILLGEHAVVYGQPALAGALSSGVTVTTCPGQGRLRVAAWKVDIDRHDPSPLGQAFAALMTRLGPASSASSASFDRERPELEVDLDVEFQVPTSAGLGSSAALAVALCRALARARRQELGTAAILDAAMAAETVFHGKPSGIDAAVAVHGGFGRFTRAAGWMPTRAARPVPLVVGHTGRQRDTKGRVARVAELASERPAEMETHFRAIGALVEQGIAAVLTGDFAALGTAMNENARHLEVLEVSCPEIEKMCTLAREAGALGAKLTGGGGGGCVLALAPGHEEAVQAAWSRAGFTSFVTEVGQVGEARLGGHP
jgi:mevalonate kinase